MIQPHFRGARLAPIAAWTVLAVLSTAGHGTGARGTARSSNQPAANGRQGAKSVEVVNRGSTIREPVLTVTPGVLREHRATFHSNGLPNIIEIAIPEEAATLWLNVRSTPGDTERLELYLYDCTSGECFSYDIRFPAAPEHTTVVRRPKAGRWIAAVNAAPFPSAPGGFLLREVITKGVTAERQMKGSLLPGQHWKENVDTTVTTGSIGEGRPIAFVELLDATLEKDEAANPWDPSPKAIRLRDRPVSLGTLILPR